MSLVDKTFNLAESLGTTYIQTQNQKGGIVMYPSPTISTTDDNTLLYIGIASGVLVLVVVVIFVIKMKS